jgi:hypothetical protein
MGKHIIMMQNLLEWPKPLVFSKDLLLYMFQNLMMECLVDCFQEDNFVKYNSFQNKKKGAYQH